jgi:hypothetical protein
VFLASLEFGLWVLGSRLFVGFLSFFFFFWLARVWFHLYTLCMLRGALRFFNIFLCLPIYIKKKNLFIFLHILDYLLGNRKGEVLGVLFLMIIFGLKLLKENQGPFI